jgi:hypothetical protein
MAKIKAFRNEKRSSEQSIHADRKQRMKVPVDVITAEAGGKKTMLKLRDQTPDVDELELATGRTAQRIGHDQRASRRRE